MNTNEKMLRLIANQLLWMCDGGIVDTDAYTLKDELYSVVEILLGSNTPKDFGKDVWNKLQAYYDDPSTHSGDVCWDTVIAEEIKEMPCDIAGQCIGYDCQSYDCRRHVKNCNK